MGDSGIVLTIWNFFRIRKDFLNICHGYAFLLQYLRSYDIRWDVFCARENVSKPFLSRKTSLFRIVICIAYALQPHYNMLYIKTLFCYNSGVTMDPKTSVIMRFQCISTPAFGYRYTIYAEFFTTNAANRAKEMWRILAYACVWWDCFWPGQCFNDFALLNVGCITWDAV